MVRLGVAGIGSVANQYLGILAAGRVENLCVAALCSRSTAHMEEAAAGHGLRAVPFFTGYGAMLDSGTIDAVLITTPHYQHPGMARMATERRLHVLVEKPVGVYGEEVEALISALADHPQVVNGVMYMRRFSPAYQRVRALVEKGALGALKRVSWVLTSLYRTNAYYASSPWRGTYEGEGGGLLMTQASHQLDLLQWICGMPQQVQARCLIGGERPIQVENEAELLLTFPGGLRGQFIASAREYPGTNRLEIAGSLGSLVLTDDKELEHRRLCVDERDFTQLNGAPYATIPYETASERLGDMDDRAQQEAALREFARAVEGHDAHTQLCSVREGYRSLQIIHAAYLSHWTGRPVEVPCPNARFRAELERRF